MSQTVELATYTPPVTRLVKSATADGVKNVVTADGDIIGSVVKSTRENFGSLFGGSGETVWDAATGADGTGESIAQCRTMRDAAARVVKSVEPLHVSSIGTEETFSGVVVVGAVRRAGSYISAHRRVIDGAVYWLADFATSGASSMPVFANGTGNGTRPVTDDAAALLEDAMTAAGLILPDADGVL